MQISWQSTIIVLDRRVPYEKNNRTFSQSGNHEEEQKQQQDGDGDRSRCCEISGTFDSDDHHHLPFPKTPSPDLVLLSSGGLVVLYYAFVMCLVYTEPS